MCLTVVDKGDDWFAVDVSGETQSRTAPDLWSEGTRLNLERSLRIGDELGGHIVTGHVDAVGEVVEARPKAIRSASRVRVPRELGAIIAPKGSIALDGVSLTVNDVDDCGDGTTAFSVNIIPHTAQQTTSPKSPPGDSSMSRSTCLRAISSGCWRKHHSGTALLPLLITLQCDMGGS